VNSDVREQDNEECHRQSLNHLMPSASMSHKVWITARSYCHCWYLSQMPSRCSQRTCSSAQLRCDNPATVWHLNGEKKWPLTLINSVFIHCVHPINSNSDNAMANGWQDGDKNVLKRWHKIWQRGTCEVRQRMKRMNRGQWIPTN
jgi:hypothetical protein